ncbi:diguanylate cyclase domain-containing protein [Lacisediminimonas profundi]|uniref:diguanylate cyclase domain-containing protein n=1 Tax=Lacisediminimonas profundi TaxID=2603856 RepID=UPI00124BB7A3|nr:diguanylate cyclase [Lacisediminimonas profundi]
MERETHNLLNNYVDLLLDAVLLVDVQGRVVHVNAACERIFGYTPDELIGQPMIEFVMPEDRARTLEEAKHVMAGHPRIGFENRYIRKDGKPVHIMWSVQWSEADQMRIGVARDVTELKRTEARQSAIYAISEAAQNATDLQALFKEIYKIAAELMPVAGFAVAILDRRSGRLAFPCQLDRNGSSRVLDEEAASTYCAEVFRSGNPMLLPGEVLAGSEEYCLAMPLITPNETIGVLILSSCTPYGEKDTELLNFVSSQIARAIERKQLHAELLQAARYDELTGLPNRRLFHERMSLALARSRRKKSQLALLYLDVDDFKEVNDSLGHGVGDLVLREVATRLQNCVRESDLVSRIGGDEFVVLLEEISCMDNAQLVAGKIRTALSHPIVVDDSILVIVASIGIALCPPDGIETEQLLDQADRAMYMDKRARLQG